MKTCLLDCDRPHLARGLCKRHYAWFYDHGLFDAIPGKSRPQGLHDKCSVPWCADPHYGRGFCKSHYFKFFPGKRKTRKCARCRNRREIKARRLCGSCLRTCLDNGTIGEWPLVTLKETVHPATQDRIRQLVELMRHHPEGVTSKTWTIETGENDRMYERVKQAVRRLCIPFESRRDPRQNKKLFRILCGPDQLRSFFGRKRKLKH